MSGKFEEMINNAKITELLNKKKAEEEKPETTESAEKDICCIPLYESKVR